MPASMQREPEIVARAERGERTAGYVVAVVVNVVLLWVVHQLLDWEWPGFLTAEFDDLLPIVTASFVMSIVVNLVFVWNDAPRIRVFGNLATSAVGFVAAVRTYQIFPFDFSDYATDWSWLARLAIIVAIAGSLVAFVVELGKLVARASTAARPGEASP